MPNFPNLTVGNIREHHVRDGRNQPRVNWNTLVFETPNGVDLENEAELTSLLSWLNRLKCRLPSHSPDHELVKRHLVFWWRRWMPLINELKGFDLLKITDIHVFKATEMFEDLRIGKIESKRNRQFGPVAASKTLMAINPNVFAAWDNKIAKSIYGGKTSVDYKAHLIETKKFAQTVFSHADLLELIDPSNRIGIGKIIDEALYWGVSVK